MTFSIRHAEPTDYPSIIAVVDGDYDGRGEPRVRLRKIL
jgi:hypothetical protein